MASCPGPRLLNQLCLLFQLDRARLCFHSVHAKEASHQHLRFLPLYPGKAGEMTPGGGVTSVLRKECVLRDAVCVLGVKVFNFRCRLSVRYRKMLAHVVGSFFPPFLISISRYLNFLSEDNCWFLLYITVNRPQVYIYPPLSQTCFPSPTPSHPSRLSQSTGSIYVTVSKIKHTHIYILMSREFAGEHRVAEQLLGDSCPG